MKLITFVSIFALTLFSPASLFAFTQFNNNIKYHSAYNNIEDVKALQQVLAYAGMYTGKIDGVFGPGTYDAVKIFQERFYDEVLKPAGVAKGQATGYVGSYTRRALNNIYADIKNESAFQTLVDESGAERTHTPALTLGDIEALKSVMDSSSVRELQNKLGGLEADGVFGPKTVQRLQEEVDLGSNSSASTSISALVDRLKQQPDNNTDSASCPNNINLAVDFSNQGQTYTDHKGRPNKVIAQVNYFMSEIPAKCRCVYTSSTYRTPEENGGAGSSNNSPHRRGRAIDLAQSGNCSRSQYEAQIAKLIEFLRLTVDKTSVRQLIFTFTDKDQINSLRSRGFLTQGYYNAVYANQSNWQLLPYNSYLANQHISHLHVGF